MSTPLPQSVVGAKHCIGLAIVCVAGVCRVQRLPCIHPVHVSCANYCCKTPPAILLTRAHLE